MFSCINPARQVRAAWWSADSLTWSDAARKQGRAPIMRGATLCYIDQLYAQAYPALRPLERLDA